MNSTTTSTETSVENPELGTVDMKLENQVIAVSDVDQSKEFYKGLGWRLDDDVAPMEGLRIVQFTPPRSGTSVTFGQGSRAPRPARPRQCWSSPTSKRHMTNSMAGGST